jgi:DNA-binding NtrC family response regulator
MAKILIVDDEKSIRITLQQCLELAGYEVEMAVGGEHAIQKLAAATYDLILLDMKMPDIDGLEVLRRVKKQLAETPVIMITAYGTVATAVEAMKLGAIDYLEKPFTTDEIRGIVQSVLARASLTDEDANQSFENAIEFAKSFIQRRQYLSAVPYLKKAVSLDPQRPESYNLMGLVEELRGDKLEALKMYRAALAISPSYRPALRNLERATDGRYSPPDTESTSERK